MPTLHSLALFLAAGLALNLTPGPDMLYGLHLPLADDSRAIRRYRLTASPGSLP